MVEEKKLAPEKKIEGRMVSNAEKRASRFFAEINLTETIQRSISGNANEENKRLSIEIRLPDGTSYEEVKQRILAGIEMVFQKSKINSEANPIEIVRSKLKENFPEILKALRARKNLTMQRLAKEIGVTLSSVSKWKNGTTQPREANIRKMAEVFDVPLETFYETEK
jgi:DNA-binding XRE family transcriptional regulator